jgi:hypothetical protein
MRGSRWIFVEVTTTVTSIASFSAGTDDAYPLERQGADTAVMRFSFLALTPVKLISPRRKSRALLGKLMKSLADEIWPGKSAMNPKRFAAAIDYRGDTRILLQIGVVDPARSVGPNKDRRRGASFSPAPGRASKRKWSG